MHSRVLVVDDNPQTLNTLTTYLRSQDYHVVAVDNPMRALMEAKQQQFDSVITDYFMPMMDGVHLYAMLRETAGYEEAPIVVLTTNASDKFRAQANEAGVEVWFEKPLTEVKWSMLLAQLSPSEGAVAETTKPVASDGQAA